MSVNNQTQNDEAIDESGNDLPTSPDKLLNTLKNLNISYDLHHHEAVYTVAESQKVDANIPGTHCRNLFLRDRKKKNYLLVLPITVDVDLKKLPDALGSHRLSFGSDDRLWQYLGVRSGSVCPFCITNDTDGQVEIFLEKTMMEQDKVNYHPMLNTMTVSLKPTDLLKFIESTGHKAHIIDLSEVRPET
jgi:Ala-tRNA(Pro) deacylase